MSILPDLSGWNHFDLRSTFYHFIILLLLLNELVNCLTRSDVQAKIVIFSIPSHPIRCLPYQLAIQLSGLPPFGGDTAIRAIRSPAASTFVDTSARPSRKACQPSVDLLEVSALSFILIFIWENHETATPADFRSLPARLALLSGINLCRHKTQIIRTRHDQSAGNRTKILQRHDFYSTLLPTRR